MTAAIQIDNLEHSYDDAVPILECAEWQLQSGGKLLVAGRSGSGKSTLLNLIGGFLKPTQGSIQVLGTDISRLNTKNADAFRALHLGIVMQRPHLLPHLSILNNLVLAGIFASPLRHPPQNAAILDLCEELEIGSAIFSRLPEQLSMGQAQRVTIARALLGDPKIILADEPTSALDNQTRDTFLDLLFGAAEKRNLTLLVASHDQSIAERFDAQVDMANFAPKAEAV